jgi:chromosome segregation ATPase
LKELLKKIIEKLGNENLVLVGNEKIEGVDVVKPTEFDLSKKYENVLIENLDTFDPKKLDNIIKRSKRVFILFSLEDYIEKMEKLVENFLSGANLRSSNLDEFEKLKKMKESAGILKIDNSNLLIVFQQEKSQEMENLKPFSQFFLNVSVVEYLKAKLEELKKENLSLLMQLKNLKCELQYKENEMNRIKEFLESEIKRLKIEKERKEEERQRLIKEFKTRESVEKKRFRKEIIRLLKEKEKLKEEREKLKEELENKIMEMEKSKLNEIKKLKEELENAIIEFGKKLEEKEEEIKKLKTQIFSL